MEFLIADTFTDGLARLTNEEQKAVKTTAFDLQMNPANPGMQFHKLDKAKDKNFWSVRVSSDIRLIVHKTDSSLLLCYVGHHDDAYRWAERRKLETHPTTGAAQLVEIRERIEEIVVPVYVGSEMEVTAAPKPLLFAQVDDEVLLGYGVPMEWIMDVKASDEDGLLRLADHLPAEAAEALLELATGGTPKPVAQLVVADPFEHPDAQRRFRVVTDVDELARALDFPWDKWTVFLHPAQRQIVERDFNGPARVSGSAGTGKTVVALHRAVHLARNSPAGRGLLTTFSDTLANALRSKLRSLIDHEPRLGERLEVASLNSVARRLYEANFGRVEIASGEWVKQALSEELDRLKDSIQLSLHFVAKEWDEVVDARQLTTWEEYRDVKRLGRKTRLPEPQRAVLWQVFDALRVRLSDAKLTTQAGLFGRLTAHYQKGQGAPFDFIVVDESQDVNVPQLKFLSALAANKPNGLFFAGDLGQRIFQTPFSWLSLDVDVRGRSRTLHVNYRTSHQIRAKADLLLGPEIADVDGLTEDRRGTVSVFNGPIPSVRTFSDEALESEGVGSWLREQLDRSTPPHEIGVFVRSDRQLDRGLAAARLAGVPAKVLDKQVSSVNGHVSVCTMHLAKGLEFRAVAVMACDDEVVPLQERIEEVGDDADLKEVYDTERHLLYVACTRAREHLLVTGVEPPSEFLDDLRM